MTEIRVALAGDIHRAIPEEFDGEKLDVAYLCQDDVCLWYQIADSILKADTVRRIRADAYDEAAATARAEYGDAHCDPNPYRDESESNRKPGYF